MLQAKILIAPGLLATAAVSSAFDRWTETPLFAESPASVNLAVVPSVGQVDRQPDQASETARFHRASDGLFYGRATLNGVSVRFVLDTGATLVVLTPADARRIGLTLPSAARGEKMETASGVSTIHRVRIDQVKVAGYAIRDVDAAVVDTGLKTSLLGQNLLAQLGPITLAADAAELR